MSSDEEIMGAGRSKLLDACGAPSPARHGVSDPLCDLCHLIVQQHQISPFNLFGFHLTHKNCYNGLRALQRLLSKDPELKALAFKILKSNPVKFEAIALALVLEDGQKRTKEQRDEVWSFVRTLVKSTSVARIKDVVLLCKEEYTAHMCQHRRMSDKQAVASWKGDLLNPDIHQEIEDGVQVIAVKLPTKISGKEKISDKMTMSNEQVPTDEKAARKAMRKPLGDTSFSSRDFGAVAGNALCTGASATGGQVITCVHFPGALVMPILNACV
jgi:hypothetical protein